MPAITENSDDVWMARRLTQFSDCSRFVFNIFSCYVPENANDFPCEKARVRRNFIDLNLIGGCIDTLPR